MVLKQPSKRFSSHAVNALWGMIQLLALLPESRSHEIHAQNTSNWLVFENSGSYSANAKATKGMSVEDAKKQAVEHKYGGFVVKGDETYFKEKPYDKILETRRSVKGATLYVRRAESSSTTRRSASTSTTTTHTSLQGDYPWLNPNGAAPPLKSTPAPTVLYKQQQLTTLPPMTSANIVALPLQVQPPTTQGPGVCNPGCFTACAVCDALCSACDFCTTQSAGPFGYHACAVQINARLDAASGSLVWTTSNQADQQTCHPLCYEVWASTSTDFSAYSSFMESGQKAWSLGTIRPELTVFKVRTVLVARGAPQVTRSAWSNNVIRSASVGVLGSGTAYAPVWVNPQEAAGSLSSSNLANSVRGSVDVQIPPGQEARCISASMVAPMQAAVASMLQVIVSEVNILALQVAQGSMTSTTPPATNMRRLLTTTSILHADYRVMCSSPAQMTRVSSQAQQVNVAPSMKQRFIQTFIQQAGLNPGALGPNDVQGSTALPGSLSGIRSSQSGTVSVQSTKKRRPWWLYLLLALPVLCLIAILCALCCKYCCKKKASPPKTRSVSFAEEDEVHHDDHRQKSLRETKVNQAPPVDYHEENDHHDLVPERGAAPPGCGFDPKRVDGQELLAMVAKRKAQPPRSGTVGSASTLPSPGSASTLHSPTSTSFHSVQAQPLRSLALGSAYAPMQHSSISAPRMPTPPFHSAQVGNSPKYTLLPH